MNTNPTPNGKASLPKITKINVLPNGDIDPDEMEQRAKELIAMAEQKRQQAAQAKAAEDAAEREELLKEYDASKKALLEVTKKIPLYASGNSKKYDELVDRKLEIEDEITQLEAKLNINQPVDAQSLPDAEIVKERSELSSNSSMSIMTVVGIVLAIITFFIAKDLATNPENTSIKGIINTAVPRVLTTTVLLTLGTLLSIFLIRLVFPDVYALWHTKIHTERNLKTLLNTAPEWSVLLFLFGCFYLFLNAFTALMGLIFI